MRSLLCGIVPQKFFLDKRFIVPLSICGLLGAFFSKWLIKDRSFMEIQRQVKYSRFSRSWVRQLSPPGKELVIYLILKLISPSGRLAIPMKTSKRCASTWMIRLQIYSTRWCTWNRAKEFQPKRPLNIHTSKTQHLQHSNSYNSNIQRRAALL